MKTLEKKTWITERVVLSGQIAGTIWMPAVECWKEFDYTLKDDDTFRDALLRITNDGDFQSCGITYGYLEVVRRNTVTGKRSTRQWELRGQGDNKDCFVSDYPNYRCQEEE